MCPTEAYESVVRALIDDGVIEFVGSAVPDNGKPIEYLIAPDEGHGFARPINNLVMVTAMEKFFAQYLGGRSQEDISSMLRRT